MYVLLNSIFKNRPQMLCTYIVHTIVAKKSILFFTLKHSRFAQLSPTDTLPTYVYEGMYVGETQCKYFGYISNILSGFLRSY
jgi:hypothetical protein